MTNNVNNCSTILVGDYNFWSILHSHCDFSRQTIKMSVIRTKQLKINRYSFTALTIAAFRNRQILWREQRVVDV